ncbi:TRAM domain-containing protein [bacterium]|nr:TRAM domain-containing protein [bacterium]
MLAFMIRSVLIILFLPAGYLIGLSFQNPVIGLLCGGLASIFLIWLEISLSRLKIRSVVVGLFGLVCGLILANLLIFSFGDILGGSPLLPFIGLYLNIIFAYLGILTAIKNQESLFGFSISSSGSRSRNTGFKKDKILDTSAIIDGRIAEICEIGFIEGNLIIPRFVLRELQYIADSSDALRRNRGRRGLDVLNKIQKNVNVNVILTDEDFPETKDVDIKLIKLGKKIGAEVVTNDYNLNKIAELEGVDVLNINELSEKLKPVVLPGEQMNVHIIKEGKEPGQGVAYLDDGTMVVIENGRSYLGQKIKVCVSSVLQTTAGRMIFTKV